MSQGTDDVMLTQNEGVVWWEEEVMGDRLPVRQLSLFSRPLVSFYRVWSIELGSHFAQVSGSLFFCPSQ
jgi:hypothetical protein